MSVSIDVAVQLREVRSELEDLIRIRWCQRLTRAQQDRYQILANLELRLLRDVAGSD